MAIVKNGAEEVVVKSEGFFLSVALTRTNLFKDFFRRVLSILTELSSVSLQFSFSFMFCMWDNVVAI